MWEQKKPTHWKVALNQPRFYALEGFQMALSRSFPDKQNLEYQFHD